MSKGRRERGSKTWGGGHWGDPGAGGDPGPAGFSAGSTMCYERLGMLQGLCWPTGQWQPETKAITYSFHIPFHPFRTTSNKIPTQEPRRPVLHLQSCMFLRPPHLCPYCGLPENALPAHLRCHPITILPLVPLGALSTCSVPDQGLCLNLFQTCFRGTRTDSHQLPTLA